MKKYNYIFLILLYILQSYADEGSKYPLTWSPDSVSDWNIIPVINRLHYNIPTYIEFDNMNKYDLLNGLSFVYEQNVFEYPKIEKLMSVEFSIMLIEVPFYKFQKIMSAASWGRNLYGLLGSDIVVYENDNFGRPIRQVERMVLSPLPWITFDTFFSLDMTKVEVIKYEKMKSTVYWRVMYSNNNSTESDVGSVEFKKYDDISTLVTFHSGHRFNYPWGLSMHHGPVRRILKSFFLRHIEKYKNIVLSNSHEMERKNITVL